MVLRLGEEGPGTNATNKQNRLGRWSRRRPHFPTCETHLQHVGIPQDVSNVRAFVAVKRDPSDRTPWTGLTGTCAVHPGIEMIKNAG